MLCCKGSSTVFGLLSVIGLLGVGVAGYSYMKCDGGECKDKANAVVVNDTESGHCALCTGHESEAKAQATLVSNKEQGEKACSEKTECSEAKACSEMAASECPMSKGAEVKLVNATNVEKKEESCCKTGSSECGEEAKKCAEASEGCCKSEKKSEGTPVAASGGGR